MTSVGKPRLLISVLSWNAPRYLENLLDNFDAMAPSGIAEWHVMVLDQGDDPRPRALLEQRRRSWLSVLFSEHNLGFAAGHNRVVETAWGQGGFDAVAVVNQDVVFGACHWADGMLAAVTGTAQADSGRPAVAVAGPTAYAIDWSARMFHRDRPAGCDSFIEMSVAMISAQAIRQAGLFDESFVPAYFEDVDLCRRYKALGLELAVMPVPHVHRYLGRAGEPPPEAFRHLDRASPGWRERNRDLFYDRWSPPASLSADQLRQRFPKVYFPGPSGEP